MSFQCAAKICINFSLIWFSRGWKIHVTTLTNAADNFFFTNQQNNFDKSVQQVCLKIPQDYWMTVPVNIVMQFHSQCSGLLTYWWLTWSIGNREVFPPETRTCDQEISVSLILRGLTVLFLVSPSSHFHSLLLVVLSKMNTLVWRFLSMKKIYQKLTH